ncbi:TlyA family RNA methyltransferase [Denitromonas iodatirespirans]|uniref:TlyA family RNA methyltransferase n=1 Tax=Denitromonas iodatirespirans TaxID=2795389 RepID=A0A944D8R4_DENI1|nr:TlyA family RNA methyltransferase [Denitromonas iodatirespirans]MBT0962205.1 TlyA family RNA methyltransferase [Denitromonas iodatirespirans]
MKSFHRRTARPAPTPAPASPPEVDRHGLQRVDSLLVARGLAPSRTAAQRMIAAGRVRSAEQPVTKPSLALPDDAELTVIPDQEDRYVSRGALKLAGAMARTGLAAHGLTALDIGQSTGGFTDCLLQAGARHVVGVEVGHDQLHSSLHEHPRITCLEGLNARDLSADDLGDAWPEGGFDLLVCDASFISLTLLMPRWPTLLRPGGRVLALVKPQFEVGREGLAKGGIVRDASLYAGVEARIRAAAEAAGLTVDDYFDSPITGGDGNREFFLAAHLPDTTDDA